VYFSVTVHYVDENFERQFAVIACIPIERSHDSNNYSKLIEEAFAKVSISKEKIHLVLRDAANVMKATTRKLEIDSFDCFLHKIQLAIEDGTALKEIGEKTATVRALVTHFNKSAPFRATLQQWQQALQGKQLALIQVI